MTVFDHYSRYYDLLYRDKDYVAESQYVASHLQRYGGGTRLLELGCGTGGHAAVLVGEGYDITGIDLSESMLYKAEQRRQALPPQLRAALRFEHGDARSFRAPAPFDSVVSLFHVASYQRSNEDLEAMIGCAARNLRPDGLFAFDFWYGPAVLSQRPETRVKELEDEEVRVTRIAQSQLCENENLVKVHYRLLIEGKRDRHLREIHETHVMRYLFLPEIDGCLERAGMQRLCAKEWGTDAELSARAWSGFVVARKRS